MIFRFIEDHRDTYPVRLMCAVLEVSPAGYYAQTAASCAQMRSPRYTMCDAGQGLRPVTEQANRFLQAGRLQ
jgi:putative transposase